MKSILEKVFLSQSLASNFQTTEINIERIDNVGITIETSGVTDNTGTFTFEVQNGSSWIDLGVSPAVQLANTDFNKAINLNQLPYKKLRIKFVAAGTVPNGTANIYVFGKSIGA